MHSTTSTPPPAPSFAHLIDTTTILSLLLTALLLFSAYALSVFTLPARTTTTKSRVIYIWHLFDALIHFLLEGSFLYYSFFSTTHNPSTSVSTPSPHVLGGDLAILHGTNYAPPNAALANLWGVYAKADKRWGVADVNVVSLELLTVLVGGPLAVWISEMLRKGEERRWFWITVLATAELYGGFMTFAPEWLTGCQNLDTSNFMYLWIYLVFFNMLWVFIPLWLLYEAYNTFIPALQLQTMVTKVSGTAASLGGASAELDTTDNEEYDDDDVVVREEDKKAR